MFDPMACFNPNKAFSMEGLLSRDMFEHFVAGDEAQYAHNCDLTTDDDLLEGDDGDDGYPSRLHFVANCLEETKDKLIELINSHTVSVIAVLPDQITLSSPEDRLEQTVWYCLTINDGPALTPEETLSTAQIIIENIHGKWLDGAFITCRCNQDAASGRVDILVMSEQIGREKGYI